MQTRYSLHSLNFDYKWKKEMTLSHLEINKWVHKKSHGMNIEIVIFCIDF